MGDLRIDLHVWITLEHVKQGVRMRNGQSVGWAQAKMVTRHLVVHTSSRISWPAEWLPYWYIHSSINPIISLYIQCAWCWITPWLT